MGLRRNGLEGLMGSGWGAASAIEGAELAQARMQLLEARQILLGVPVGTFRKICTFRLRIHAWYHPAIGRDSS